MPYERWVPHVTEKGYILLDLLSLRSPELAFAIQKKAIAKADNIWATPRDISL
jgi:hypothetical protein